MSTLAGSEISEAEIGATFALLEGFEAYLVWSVLECFLFAFFKKEKLLYA